MGLQSTNHGMSKSLALFPLNLFLLPGDYTQLYIFEPRYKQLVKECLKNQSPFGIPFFSKQVLGDYGSLVEITEVVKTYFGGEMDIIVKCIGVFTVKSFQLKSEKKEYPSGEIELFENIKSYSASSDLKKEFIRHMHEQEKVYSDKLKKPKVSAFEIANELYLSDHDKIDLLKCSGENEVNQFLINYIHYLQLLEAQEKSVYQNIYLN